MTSIDVSDMEIARTLYLNGTSAKVQAILEAIYRHRDVLDRFDQGALIVNFRGESIKLQLDKVALTPHSA